MHSDWQSCHCTHLVNWEESSSLPTDLVNIAARESLIKLDGGRHPWFEGSLYIIAEGILVFVSYPEIVASHCTRKSSS